MFASLSQYTPKQLLASYLSKSLAEFFNVDPANVESNLLQNAKVSLTEIAIRPQSIGHNSNSGWQVSGSVNLIEFTWEWDSQSLISNATLTIRGVSVRIQKDGGGVQLEGSSTTKKTALNDDSSSNDTTSDWKARYLQQIVDHLALVVTDAQLSIHLDEKEDLDDRVQQQQQQQQQQPKISTKCQVLMLEAKDLSLKTNAVTRNDVKTSGYSATLQQTMSVGSLEAWIDETPPSGGATTNTKHAVLDPFGYQATVQRVSGRRFLDGVLSGLMIQGMLATTSRTSSSSSIRVHVGATQMSGLARLQEILLAMGAAEGGSNDSVANTTECLDEERRDHISDVAFHMSQEIHSVCCLPLPSVELVLEANQTVLRCAGCTIRYCTDGSQLLVDCTEGIWMDDTPLSTKKNHRWTLDLVANQVTLDRVGGSAIPNVAEDEETDQFYDAQESNPVLLDDDKNEFRFQLSIGLLKRIWGGVRGILPQYNSVLSVAKQTRVRDEVPNTTMDKPWTLCVNGTIAFRFLGEEPEEWVEMTAKHPQLTQGTTPEAPFTYESQSMRLVSHLDGGVSIDIPNIGTKDNLIIVEGRVSARIHSIDAIFGLQRLWQQVEIVVGGELDSSQPTGLATNLRIPAIHVTLEIGSLETITLTHVEIAGPLIKVQSLMAKGLDHVSVDMMSLESNINSSSPALKIGSIESLDLGLSVGRLAKPAADVLLELTQGTIKVKVETIHFQCPNSLPHHECTEKVTPFRLSNAIVLQVQRLMIMPEFGPEKPGVCFDQLQLHAASSIGSIDVVEVKATCSYMQGRGYDNMDTLMKGLEATICIDMLHQQCIQAQACVQEISTLKLPGSFEITKSVKNLTCQLSNESVDVSCGSIYASVVLSTQESEPSGEGSHAGDSEHEDASISKSGLSFRFSAPSIFVVSEDSLATPKLTTAITELEIEKDPPSSVAPTTLRVKAGSASIKSQTYSCDVAGLMVSTKWEHEHSGRQEPSILPSVPFLGILTFASFEFSSCTNLNMANVGSLKEPILTGVLSYNEGAISVDLPSIHFDYISTVQKAEEEKQLPFENPFPADLSILIRVGYLHATSSMNNLYPEARIRRIKADIRPSLESGGTSLMVCCDLLEAGDANANSIVASKFSSQSILGLTSTAKSTSDIVPASFLGVWKGSARFDEVSKFSLAGICELEEAVSGLNAKLEDGTLSIDVNLVSVKILPAESTSSSINSDQALVMPGFPIQFKLGSCLVSEFDPLDLGSGELCIEHISVSFHPSQGDGDCHLTFDSSAVQAMCGTDSGCVCSGVSIHTTLSSLQIPQTNDSECSFLTGLEAVSQIEVNIASMTELFTPSIGCLSSELVDTTIVFGGQALNVSLGDFWMKMTQSSGDGWHSDSQKVHTPPPLVPFPIDLTFRSFRYEQETQGVMSFGSIHLHLDCKPGNPLSNRMQLKSSNLHVDDRRGSSFLSKGVVIMLEFGAAINYEHSNNITVPGCGTILLAKLEVDELSRFCHSDSGVYLSAPAKKLSLRFAAASGAAITCPNLALRRVDQKIGDTSDIMMCAPLNFELPCNISLTIDSFSLDGMSSGQVLNTWNGSGLSLSLEPTVSKIATTSEGPGAVLFIRCGISQYTQGTTMLQMSNISASGVVQFSNLDRLSNLDVGVKGVKLSADFSSNSWSNTNATTDDTTKSIQLPFAVVHGFDLLLSGTGPLIRIKDAAVHCKGFEGNLRTTVDNLSSHYVKAVKGRIPYLLSKASVAGANVGDSLGMMAGTVVMRHSLIGSTIGIAARDAVGGTLTMGKERRGASATEKYKFGDLSRGVIASVKSAGKRGAGMRGDDKYAVGDFSTGTASAAGEYTSKNRVRLAGAGGSAIGMVAGAALGGPIGLIAGSFLGSSAGQSSMRAVGGNPETAIKEGTSSEQQTPLSETSNTTDPMEQGAIPDLLASPNAETSEPPRATDVEAEWVGDIASASHRAVMVQAQVFSTASTEGASSVYQDSYQVEMGAISNTTFDSFTSQVPAIVQPSSVIPTRPTTIVGDHPLLIFNPPPEQHPIADPRTRTAGPTTPPGVHPSIYNDAVSGGHITQSATASARAPAQEQNQSGYRFGDVTRGIVARGKQSDGRDVNSGYKFGDFTRGFFR